jgi:hypothetical protein
VLLSGFGATVTITEEIIAVIRVHFGKFGKFDIASPTLLELVGLAVVLAFAALVIMWLWR